MVQLVVSIDTEEEGLWGGCFDPHPPTENLHGLTRFQQFCEDREILPTYLIDAPVVMDEGAVSHLRRWQDSEKCEVGSHCHPWCNPPLDGKPISGPSTFLCNLDAATQRRKLQWLTDAIESKLGRRPTSFRAGRYGLDSVGANLLADLGYVVDSSVLPLRNYAGEGGPDFRQAPLHPYRVDHSNLLAEDPAGRLLEVPVTCGFTRPGFRWRKRCRDWLTAPPLAKLRFAGMADRLDVLRLAKLSPEQTTVRDASKLVDAAVRDGASVLVLMFHSSSLLPGFSPYVKTDAQLELFYTSLGTILHHCLSEIQCTPTTLSEFAKGWPGASRRSGQTLSGLATCAMPGVS